MKLYRKFCMLVSTIAALAAVALPVLSSASDSASQPPSKPSVVQTGTTDALNMVSIKGKIVSAAWKDFFYIEDSNRTAAVRVEKSDHGLSEGAKVDILATISRNANGEIYLVPSTVTQTDTVPKPRPLGMPIRTVIEGAWAWRWVHYPGEKARYEWTGPHAGLASGTLALGLYIKTWGTIGQIDPEGKYFYLQDGSDVWDGTLTAGTRNYGVRVACDGVAYASGQFVVVTGVVSRWSTGDGYPRGLLYLTGIQVLTSS